MWGAGSGEQSRGAGSGAQSRGRSHCIAPLCEHRQSHQRGDDAVMVHFTCRIVWATGRPDQTLFRGVSACVRVCGSGGGFWTRGTFESVALQGRGPPRGSMALSTRRGSARNGRRREELFFLPFFILPHGSSGGGLSHLLPLVWVLCPRLSRPTGLRIRTE